MKKIPIQLHTGNALVYLGTLYHNPAEALKEHASNAIDEYLKAKVSEHPCPACRIEYCLERDKVTIAYPYGMSKAEVENAFQNVADSAKQNLTVAQIGRLGIGIFSFLAVGKQCQILTRKSSEDETLKVTLRHGAEDAEVESASKRESLAAPGIKIVISQLLSDPMRARGPLAPERLQRFFAEKFHPYLKDGSVAIVIRSRGTSYDVKPLLIGLPKVLDGYVDVSLKEEKTKRYSLDLYFDATGKGIVGIRHAGVLVVENIRNIEAYGLEESVFANGYMKGYIDANFLKPLPARFGFEPNSDWIGLLDALDGLRPTAEREIESLRQEEAEKRLSEIQKRALELANEILNQEEFRDLELLDGTRGKRAILPPNGFDFVPATLRISPGEEGKIPLKARIPERLLDNTRVALSIEVGEKCVKLRTPALVLKASDADEDGVVTQHVVLFGVAPTAEPAVLTAVAEGGLSTSARVRVAEAGESREGTPRAGSSISYRELPFEDQPFLHSRYIERARMIEINEVHKDYIREVKNAASAQAQLGYATLMIGKETVAHADRTGGSNDGLEKLLTFYFELKNRLTGAPLNIAKRPRGRPRKSGATTTMSLPAPHRRTGRDEEPD